MPNQHDEISRLTAVTNDTFARLESSFDQLRRFTADASHELRTPLAVIRGIGEGGLRETRTPAEYTWAAFVGTNENAAIAGDVAMLATEVTPVLKALRQNGLDVVAIHHHMTGTQPTIYFLHYWGTGPADKLAAAFRAALDQLGTPKGTAAKP